jgi:c-di-GMP-binding flagellar brake protein YcgR
MRWEPELEVRVRVPAGEVLLGRCMDVEFSQDEVLVSVEFPAERTPVLRLGEGAELEFRGGGLGSAMSTEACTLMRTDDQTRCCYCFGVKLSKGSLFLLVNRRRSDRVQLPASEPVRVRILDVGEDTPEVTLHDISATGLSILMDPALEARLFSRLELRLAVKLGGEEKSIELITAIRHRRLLGSAILYGLEIDGRIPDFLRAKDRILLYVANLRGRQ